MKKSTIILSVLFALTISATNIKAQDAEMDTREKVQFGLKLGLNYSNVYDEQGDDFQADPKLGLAGGAFLSLPMGKYIGIQPELLVSQKGFKATGRVLGGTYDFTRTTTYLDVPLQFALKPSEFFTIVAGPQYSYLLNQRDVFANATTSIAQEQEFVNDNVRKNMFGVVGGIDINIKHVVVSARTGWDLTQNNGDGTSQTPRYKNVWFQGTVGFKF
ncbi:MAG: porin family protein [Bacteroidota bacterium]